MSPVRLLLAATAVLALLSSFQQTPDAAASSAAALQGETWTIMEYMAADAYPELYWTPDINEMESVDLPDSVDVVALVDPLGSANSVIYEIVQDPQYLDPAIYSPVVDDGGQVVVDLEVDTGSPATLAAFMEFVITNHPADRYALVLWGHGGGWVGLCPDGVDILTLPELRTALEESEADTGERIDLLAVDACAEATLETAYEIRDCADFFVASERTVPGEGFPYDLILGDLADDPDMTAEELGNTIVDRYIEWADFGSEYCETMTMFNLSSVEPFMATLDSLASECIKFNGIYDEALYDALWDSESYEDYENVDLGDLVTQLTGHDLPIELGFTALQTALVYSDLVDRFEVSAAIDPEDGITMDDATGMVAFVPVETIYPEYDELMIAGTQWPTMALVLSDDLSPIDETDAPTVTVSDGDGDGWDDMVNVSWSEGATEVASVDLWAFRQESGGVAFHEHVASDGWSAGLQDLHGLFVISVSALDGTGMAVSHHDATTTFPWEVVIEVVAHGVDGVPTDGCVAYAVLTDGTAVAAEGGDGLDVTLELPEQVDYGQMVRMELRDEDGAVVGWAFAVVSSDHTVCDIVVVTDQSSADDGPDASEVALVAISWAAAAVAVAYAVRLRRRTA